MHNKKQNIMPFEFGKIPPNAIELEEAILGALMIEPESYYKIGHVLTPQSFYKDANQKIFEAIQLISTSGRKSDILTVCDKLRTLKYLDEVGGNYYVSELAYKIGSASNIEYHASIVKQKYIARELIRFTSELQSRAYDESNDVSDIIDLAQNELYKIVSGTITKEAVKASVIINEEIESIANKVNQNIQCTGVPSGFTSLDRISGGWQNNDLIILAARPSMGKTALSLYFAKFPASINIPVAYFSLEMSSNQIAKRLISYDTKIDSMKLSRAALESSDFKLMEKSLSKFENYKLYIDDTPALSITEFASKAKLYKMKYNIGLIVVDYLQLMQGIKNVNRDQEIGSITRNLKTVAKSLNIPIICLAQLSRAVEKVGDKRPKLSDLRESGNIEQDADIVCFIHRPEKYGILEDEEGNSTIGMIDLIIAKHRNGATGDVFLWSDESFNNLRDTKEIETSYGYDFNINKNIEPNKLEF